MTYWGLVSGRDVMLRVSVSLDDKPETDADYRAVDNGDFVSYRQWFDDGSEWDIVAVDLRQASKGLALAALSQPEAVSA
jgi:hypothetical protein